MTDWTRAKVATQASRTVCVCVCVCVCVSVHACVLVPWFH